MVTNAQERLDLTFPVIRKVVGRVCAGKPVRRMDLFGSFARGEGRAASDVDLLVDFIPGSGIGLLELGELHEDLVEALGRPVDLVSRKAVESSTNPYRRRAILDSCVEIYAR